VPRRLVKPRKGEKPRASRNQACYARNRGKKADTPLLLPEGKKSSYYAVSRKGEKEGAEALSLRQGPQGKRSRPRLGPAKKRNRIFPPARQGEKGRVHWVFFLGKLGRPAMMRRKRVSRSRVRRGGKGDMRVKKGDRFPFPWRREGREGQGPYG